MREIKFRAWNEKDKCMSTEIGLYDFDKDGKNNFPESCCSIMQYTGLKDKNGKEIYEGDIVMFGPLNYEVYFDENTFSFRCKNLNNKFFSHRELYGYSWIIIGNIYKNEEMLK
jgi:hypothetical protein